MPSRSLENGRVFEGSLVQFLLHATMVTCERDNTGYGRIPRIHETSG